MQISIRTFFQDEREKYDINACAESFFNIENLIQISKTSNYQHGQSLEVKKNSIYNIL